MSKLVIEIDVDGVQVEEGDIDNFLREYQLAKENQGGLHLIIGSPLEATTENQDDESISRVFEFSADAKILTVHWEK